MLDPVAAAERHMAAQDLEAFALHQAHKALRDEMLEVLRTDHTRRVTAPGFFTSDNDFSALNVVFSNMDEGQQHTLLTVLRRAARGEDVQLQAQAVQYMLADAHGEAYRDAMVLGCEAVL
jgi:hypothetical protein